MNKQVFSLLAITLSALMIPAICMSQPTTAKVTGIVLAPAHDVKAAKFKCTDELFIIKRKRYCVIKEKKVVLKRSTIDRAAPTVVGKKRLWKKPNPFAGYKAKKPSNSYRKLVRNKNRRTYQQRRPKKRIVIKRVRRSGQTLQAENLPFTRNDI